MNLNCVFCNIPLIVNKGPERRGSAGTIKLERFMFAIVSVSITGMEAIAGCTALKTIHRVICGACETTLFDCIDKQAKELAQQRKEKQNGLHTHNRTFNDGPGDHGNTGGRQENPTGQKT